MSAVTDTTRPDLGGNIRHGDTQTHCPAVWSYLIDRFAIRSVLDVGCGEGHAVAWFNRLGIYTVGIDGLLLNVARAVHPIIQHDLTERPFYMRADMVWSCEVAEHIAPGYVDYYLDTLANADIVAMTHAVPGQGGHHHVNEKPAAYWIEKMAARGYTLHPETEHCRRIDEAWTYFTATGLIFTR